MRLAFALLAIACGAIPSGAAGQTGRAAMKPVGAQSTSLAIAHRDAITDVMARRISLDLHDVPLGEALAQTAFLSRLHLVYADGLIPDDARVTLEIQEISPSLAFSILLASTNLRVVISPSGYAAVVQRQRAANVVVSSTVRPGGLPHTRLASGTHAPVAVGIVQDETGSPIAGAYVRLCGTRQVELTDSRGRFAFPAASGALPRVSASATGHSDRIARVPLHSDGEPPPVLRLRRGQRSLSSAFCPERPTNSRP